MRFFDSLNRFFTFISGWLILAAAVAVTLDVILRMFGHAIQFANPFSQYTLIWSMCLSVALVLHRSEHIVIDLLFEKVSSKKQRMFTIITSAVGFAVCATLCWFSFVVTKEYYATKIMFTEGLLIPRYVVYMVMPIGFLLLSIEFLRAFIDTLIPKNTLNNT